MDRFFATAVILLSFNLAVAQPEIVRIKIQPKADQIDFAVDHNHNIGPELHYSVFINCASTADTPVVFTNESNLEVQILSTVGLATLSAANDFGPHSATFRSVFSEQSVLMVMDPLQYGKTKAVFKLVCQ